MFRRQQHIGVLGLFPIGVLAFTGLRPPLVNMYIDSPSSEGITVNIIIESSFGDGAR
jgi:hypothetical protein